MKVSLLVALLVVVAAVSVADAGLIKLIVRGITIGVKAIIGAVSGGGTATVVTTAVLTTADLALNLGNVLSGGCMYEKEICSLTPEIEKLEKQMVPLYNQLTTLDKQTNQLYNQLTKNLEKNNELAQLSDSIMSLVVSIVQKLGEPQKLDRLGQEFERNTNNMVSAFKSNMDQYKAALEAKAVTSSISDVSVLLYYGTKTAYTSLKSAGKISSPSMLKNVKFPTTGLSKIAKPKVFTTVASSLSSVKSFFKKPSVVKFASKAASGGMVLGSLVGLGVTLAVDISKARQMRDSLRRTRDEMKQIMNQMKTEIAREKQALIDLNKSYLDIRRSYINFVNMINPSLKTKLNANGGRTPSQLYTYQVQAIATFKKIVQDLRKVDANFSVIKEVRLGVDLGDDVSRIISTISRKGLGKFSTSQILNIIAEEYPKMNNYNGAKLGGYRSG